MKSLQRLEQHLLATDPLLEHWNVPLTPRAERLRKAFRRGVAVGATATAAFAAAGTGLYMKTGPGTFDPQQIFAGDSASSQRMVGIYDTHRRLMGARERIHEIRAEMIQGYTTGPVSLTLEQQAAQLRAARADAAKNPSHRLRRRFTERPARERHTAGNAGRRPYQHAALPPVIALALTRANMVVDIELAPLPAVGNQPACLAPLVRAIWPARVDEINALIADRGSISTSPRTPMRNHRGDLGHSGRWHDCRAADHWRLCCNARDIAEK